MKTRLWTDGKNTSWLLLNEHNDYKIDESAKTEGPLREITEVEIEAALKGRIKRKQQDPQC